MAKMNAAKRIKAATDKTIERIYYATCSGVQINIMDISKVFAVGRASIAANDDEAMTTRKIVEFVQTIRSN